MKGIPSTLGSQCSLANQSNIETNKSPQMEQKWRKKIFSQMKFISICFICLQRGRDRNGHGRRAAWLQEAATPGSGPCKRPGPSPQRLSRGRDCLSGDSTGQTAPWWRSRRERKRRSSLQQKPEVWKRAHRGEVPGGEGGQRREAAAWRHNIQIMVSPQHPCEVGWKVATIVMPTSQTRPGHRGKNTRDGLARQGGPSPLSGLPSIPAEPGPPATQLLVGHGG